MGLPPKSFFKQSSDNLRIVSFPNEILIGFAWKKCVIKNDLIRLVNSSAPQIVQPIFDHIAIWTSSKEKSENFSVVVKWFQMQIKLFG